MADSSRLKAESAVGAVAQLGEHLLCKQGVTGSIPVSSTKSHSLFPGRRHQQPSNELLEAVTPTRKHVREGEQVFAALGRTVIAASDEGEMFDNEIDWVMRLEP